MLRGDHGCRLLPPVPTVTIESHGCPGDAGAGRAAAPVRLTSGSRWGGGGGPGAGLLQGCAMCVGAGRPSQPLGTREGTAGCRARAGSAPRTAAAGAAGLGLRTLGTEGPGPRSGGAARRRWPWLGRVTKGGPGSKQSTGSQGAAGALPGRGRAVPLSPAAGGAAALPPPRLPPFRAPALADRHAALDVKAL